MSITVDDIEALRRVLAELPRHQPKQVSKQEAVALLAAELGAAQRRGYKPDQLAELFAERGIMINAATLRGYLRRTRKSRRRATSTGATKNKSAIAATKAPPAAARPSAPAAVQAPAPAPARTAAVGTQDRAVPPPRILAEPADTKDPLITRR
jgi:hypothetical protein